MRLLLASASPRRAELLAAAGFDFDVEPSDVDEAPQVGEIPRAYVGRLATAKALAVERRNPGRIVLGADTSVVIDGELLGKPEDAADAARMLQLLSGRDHEVLTGVAVAWAGRTSVAVDLTRVRFLPLDEEEIAWYVGSGEPRGKAGAYAIQGLASRFVERIDGSYCNVMGLPIAVVYRLLRDLGVLERIEPGGPHGPLLVDGGDREGYSEPTRAQKPL